MNNVWPRTRSGALAGGTFTRRKGLIVIAMAAAALLIVQMVAVFWPSIAGGDAAAATGRATGFAAGTTGGAGGPVVSARSGTDINRALCGRANDDSPIVIQVEGTINHGNTTAQRGSCDTAADRIQLKNVSNITIVGVGSGATFDQLGIQLRDASNIIIQNVTVRNVKKSGSPTSNGGDAIGMEKTVRNVWVDHVTLEASGGESDGYDALFDMKNDVQNVTLSYSILRNSDRGGLVGSGDQDTGSDKITFHNNLYQNLKSRTPLLRAATAHMYNNHYVGLRASGINSRVGGKAKIENNYFEDSADPIGTFYTSARGGWQLDGNIFDNITWTSPGPQNFPAGPDPKSTTTVSVPYSYKMDPANCVPDIVNRTAGANKGLRVSDGKCNPTTPSAAAPATRQASTPAPRTSTAPAPRTSSAPAPRTSSAPAAPAPRAPSNDRASNGFPFCVPGRYVDPDFDGWGWQNRASCVVRGSKADPASVKAPNGWPYCINGRFIDPDGDGWGWGDNSYSCLVRGGKADGGSSGGATRTPAPAPRPSSAPAPRPSSAPAPRPSAGANGTSPTAPWPTATRTEQLRGTRTISGNFDGGNTRYQLSGGSQAENQPPLFLLKDGAVIRNVIIGNRAADGIHCEASCTLINVWWEDVGEDAATMLTNAPASAVMTIDGGGARKAEDKVFQHNGDGTMVVRNFQAEDIGKLVRTCGNCSISHQRDVVIDNVVVRDVDDSVVGINLNFGDTATITRLTYHGAREPICEHYRGVPRGQRSTRIGEGPNSQCRYRASDITYR